MPTALPAATTGTGRARPRRPRATPSGLPTSKRTLQGGCLRSCAASPRRLLGAAVRKGLVGAGPDPQFVLFVSMK